jgi:hypothetical protein
MAKKTAAWPPSKIWRRGWNRISPAALSRTTRSLLKAARSRPVAVDWNGDGKLDLLRAPAGYIQFREYRLQHAPVFEDCDTCGRRQSHPSHGRTEGSVQVRRRPSGATQYPVADWDLTASSIFHNDIWGAVVWYRNIGTATSGAGAAPPIEVEWPTSPKPDWVWWPKGKQLVTSGAPHRSSIGTVMVCPTR